MLTAAHTSFQMYGIFSCRGQSSASSGLVLRVFLLLSSDWVINMLHATCCNHVYVHYLDVGVAHSVKVALVHVLTERFRRVVSVKISTFCAEILILASF